MVVSRATLLTCFLLLSYLLVTASEDKTQEEDVPCDENLSVEIKNGLLLHNGSMLAPNGVLYMPGQFWIDANNPDIVKGCICQIKNCIRKCCPDHHVYDWRQRGLCMPKNHTLLQPFPPIKTQITNREDTHVLFGDICMHGKYKDDYFDSYTYESKGHLISVDSNSSYEANEYCLEVHFENGTEAIYLFACFPPHDEDEETVYGAELIIYPLGMLISEPFLVATFLVYAIIPELRNIHGKNLMSHVTSLFVAYLFLAIVQLGGKSVDKGFCIAAAFIIYYSFLASFFWLNVMCFDLWWTFSGFKPLRGSVRERDHKKFIIYSLYCWGAPFFMLVIALIMDFTGNKDTGVLDDNRYIVPGFGDKSCWFGSAGALWAYFYGPVAVILSVNLIMFITTAIKIVQLKKETAMLKGSESKRHDDEENKQRFSLYLKLFIVMGVNWAMEVISAGAEAAGWPTFLWYITDIGNTLQGVLIFIIFVWKEKIRKMIRRRMDGTDRSVQSTSCKSTRVFSSTRSSSRMLSLCACKCLPETQLRRMSDDNTL